MLCDTLPNQRAANIGATQLIRCATLVGANYRAACRARSQADFVSKIGVTLEETDESVYWMELLVESNMRTGSEICNLVEEGNELVAIFNASFYTARKSSNKPYRSNQKSAIKNQK